jgi:hypothetical protein
MRIPLSIFENKYMDALNLCGIIFPTDPEPLRELIPAKPEPVETRHDTANGPIWFRLITNWQKEPKGIHFHIDTATETSFSDIPAVADHSGNTERILDAIAGHSVRFRARGRFAVKRELLRKESVINPTFRECRW